MTEEEVKEVEDKLATLPAWRIAGVSVRAMARSGASFEDATREFGRSASYLQELGWTKPKADGKDGK